MAFLVSFIFLSSWTAVGVMFPYNTLLRGSRFEWESSGSNPDQPVQGVVKVVQLDPRTLAQSGFFKRGLVPRRVLPQSSRSPFPAFLSRGRPDHALEAPVNLQNRLSPKVSTETELKKQQGLQMWQRVTDKGGKTSLPVSVKDTKQTCTTVPFTQRVTADGCQPVTVHNKLCFGQCSSLFVPSEGEFAAAGPATGAFQRRGPCSRCAPSRAQTVAVVLRCGAEVREKRVMMVEECKCETGREQRSAEAAASTHL